jgi:hypothetical protein
MPEKHRELVRIMLHTGMAFLEVAWDVTVPRRIIVPEEETEGEVEEPGLPPEEAIQVEVDPMAAAETAEERWRPAAAGGAGSAQSL